MLCSPYGTIAYVAGAALGGLGGMILGTVFATILVRLCIVPYAFTRAVAKIYWELLSGRRKLPDSSTHAERRQLYAATIVVFAVAMMVLAGASLFGSEAQRSRAPATAVIASTTCVAGLFILKVHHRRHRPRGLKSSEESDE